MKKKPIAIFMIYIIIAVSFFVYKSPEVSAEQQACCQYAKSGESCIYTDVSQCDSKGLKSFTSCDNTDYCKLGCCIDTKQGDCAVNTPKSLCLKNGFTWNEDATCNIAQCRSGCCRLGTECSFVTQQRCVIEASAFPGLQPIFEEAISSEETCINSCKSLEKGACVFTDKTCKLTSRVECTAGTFHANFLCSNPKLGTICSQQQYTNCLKEDVYWYDSCGNPENPYSSNKELSYNNGILIPEKQVDTIYKLAKENDANNGNCDYPSRNLCGKAEDIKPKFGEYICKPIDCKQTTEYPNLEYTGIPRESGESWCLYDARTGFGYDVVGSRHFRAVCINGEELIEPCKDYREEFCIQNKDIDGKLISKEKFLNLGKDFSEAMCRTNRFDECSKCNEQLDIKKAVKCCEDISKRDCYWQEFFNQQGGMCVPLVPPGQKFWDASASEDTCAKANQVCKVYYEHGGWEKAWTILGPKECTTKNWVISGNTLCKAVSDCGAWYNIAGKSTTDGFSMSTGDKRNQHKLTTSDLDNWNIISQQGKQSDRQHSFGAFIKRGWTIGSLAVTLGTGIYAGFAGGVFGAGLISPFTAIGHLISGTAPKTSLIAASMGAFQIQAGEKVSEKIAFNLVSKEFATNWVSVSNLDKLGLKLVDGEYIATKTIQGTAELGTAWIGTLLFVLNIISWIYLAYEIWDIVGADKKSEIFQTQCMPWSAPDGGSDCEKCNSFIGGCSEYRCKSLGKGCKLINEGTTDEKCTWISDYDTKSPVIKANPAKYKKEFGYTITETKGLGFKITEPIKPFTPATLYIETDEPAQCKFSINPNRKFEEMEFNFGSSAMLYNHTITFALPSNFTDPAVLKITNNGNYDLYTKCKDANGNENIKDYYIKFSISKGPDMTAPKIEFVSIPSNSYIPYDASSIAISIFVSEPSDCKWDTVNRDFSSMKNTFTCAQSAFDYTSIYYGLYECTSVLDITEKINNYFFKCSDKSEKANTMSQSYQYTLKSTTPLEISEIEPEAQVNTENPVLKVTTSAGAENGIAVCGYSETPNMPLQSIPMFQKTNSTAHEQQLMGLSARTYKFYITCIDIAGNQANSDTSFEVTVDKNPPKLIQIYTDQTTLTIVTSEKADCEYGLTSFNFGSGNAMISSNNKHQASLDPDAIAYYIRCRDEHDNIMSATVYP